MNCEESLLQRFQPRRNHLHLIFQKDVFRPQSGIAIDTQAECIVERLVRLEHHREEYHAKNHGGPGKFRLKPPCLYKCQRAGRKIVQSKFAHAPFVGSFRLDASENSGALTS